MPELLLPRLKQEIEARLAELRPIVAEIEQLEAAKAALLARAEAPAAEEAAPPRPRRSAARGGGRRRRAAATETGGGERAPRGANRDAIVALVEERPGVSVAEIASVTRIPKATVATTVSKLKRDGVLADEAGGVKLASRQRVTLAEAAAAAAPPRADGASDDEWDGAAPDGDAEEAAAEA